MGWFGPQSGVCTCCNDGPPPEDTCGFDCTGDEPEMLGVEVDLGSTGTAGCSCSGSGTYLFPAGTYVTRPGLGGTEDNCYYCWNNINFGTCCILLLRRLKAEEEQYGGLPATLLAPCDSNPDEYTGYSYGFFAALYFDYFIYGTWEGDLCAQFKTADILKYTLTIHASTQIAVRVVECETRYRRQWKMVKQPGVISGPEGDFCTWEPEWVDGSWSFEPGYDGTECPPPDSECIGAEVCASVTGDIVWNFEGSIVNCTELLDFKNFTKVSTGPGMTGSCCTTTSFIGTEYTDCYDYSTGLDWGCSPTAIRAKLVPTP